MGLAAVRQAAHLTQTELAQRMGIKAGSGVAWRSRGDVLLSTLASYLAAAGAKDVVLTARLGEQTIEVALPASAPSNREGRRYAGSVAGTTTNGVTPSTLA